MDISKDISHTIIAKSDQLNAGDLFGGPITVTVTSVKVTVSDQPVTIAIDGDRMPYKPCLSMRRVLAKLWGTDSSAWVGRSLTLYCDETVRWAGQAVGGIRISHMTDIDRKQSVTVRASSKNSATYEISPLSNVLPPYPDSRIDENAESWTANLGKTINTDTLITAIRKKFRITDEQIDRIISMEQSNEE